MQKQEFTYKDATHYLSCAHQINPRNRNEYHMECIILKELPNNRAKILVFGDRRRKIELSGHKKRVRYVSKDRLSVIPQTSPTQQADEISIRDPKEYPDDEEYYQLCIDEPRYKLMGVYLEEDIKAEFEDIINSLTYVIRESEDVYSAIEMLEDLRTSLRKKIQEVKPNSS